MALKSKREDIIYELYLEAKRFDEGEIYQSQEYEELVNRKLEVLENLGRKLDIERALLEEYIFLTDDETELECRHYFREGYLAGLADRKIKDPLVRELLTGEETL